MTLSCDHNCDSTTIRPRQDYDEKIDVLFFARVVRVVANHGAAGRNSLRHNKHGFYER